MNFLNESSCFSVSSESTGASESRTSTLTHTTTVIRELDNYDKPSTELNTRTDQQVSNFMSGLGVDSKNNKVDDDDNKHNDDEDDDDAIDSAITCTAPGTSTTKSDFDSYEKLVASAHFGKLGEY